MASVVSRIVEVVVFRWSGDRPRVLLLRRAGQEPIYPGMWQIVTGTVQEAERAVDAALRELQEETGMRPQAFWIVPYTNSFYEPRRDEIHLIPFFAAQVAEDARVLLSPEHDDFCWVSFEEASKRVPWPGQQRGLELVLEHIVAGRSSATLLAFSL